VEQGASATALQKNLLQSTHTMASEKQLYVIVGVDDQECGPHEPANEPRNGSKLRIRNYPEHMVSHCWCMLSIQLISVLRIVFLAQYLLARSFQALNFNHSNEAQSIDIFMAK
jgi:hypothetical protein